MRRAPLELLRLSLLGAIASTGCTGGQSPAKAPAQPVEPVAAPTPAEGGASAASEFPPPPGPCHGDAPIVGADGAPTGFSRCEDGAVHRREVVTCGVPETPPNACPGEGELIGDCKVNADCSERPLGRCVTQEMMGPMPAEYQGKTLCGCVYACERDDDCPDGACVCPGALLSQGDKPYPEHLPTCVRAQCHADAECESGECGATAFFNGCSTEAGLWCRRPDQECRSDEQCPEEGVYCDRGSCSPLRCMIGRLLQVDGEVRVATVRDGAGWDDPDARAGLQLDPATRAAFVARWRQIALLEHASVASFARFALQLLALGAPPALLRASAAAARDEVAHARLCFGLTSVLGPARPGPLAVAGIRVERARVEVAAALFEEACLGETLGVVEALEAARACEDPGLADVLSRIARDETRHAQLAWRALTWLVSTSDADERAAIVTRARRAIARAERALEHDYSDMSREGEEVPGALAGAARRAVHRAALREVVRPCARAAFDARPAPAQAAVVGV